MSLAEEIKKIVKGEVRDGADVLKAFSSDASIFAVHPELVVAPHSPEDVMALVKFVNEHKSEYPHLSLTARAAGTDMSGGPLSESIVLDFMTYFQGVKNVDEGKQESTVLPGTYYRDFEKATLEKGLLLPCYTASRELCTVGGMVANNSGGEKTLRYGKTIDFVNELKVVLSDGELHSIKPLSKSELEKKITEDSFEGHIYKQIWELISENKELLAKAKPKVHKNSAGYYLWDIWNGETQTFDLNKLIVGSQGTLGIVTEIKYRLIKPAEHSALLVIFLDGLTELAKVVGKVLEFHPESFESYDDQTMKLAVRFAPDLLKRLGAKNLLSLGLKFWPEIKMILTGGVPKLILVAEFTGDSEKEVYDKAYEAERALKPFDLGTHVAYDDAEENKYWTIRRESFALLRKHVHGKHTAPFIDDIVVIPEHLPEFLPWLADITKDYKINYTIAGHVGDGNFHIIPLMDFARPDMGKIIRELSQKVYALVIEFGGSITGEHNDGLIRTPFLEQMYGKEVVALFKRTKEIMDPLNIFNTGKKVPVYSQGSRPEGGIEHLGAGTLGYALEHFRHDWS